jgi:hypothetical protein
MAAEAEAANEVRIATGTTGGRAATIVNRIAAQ